MSGSHFFSRRTVNTTIASVLCLSLALVSATSLSACKKNEDTAPAVDINTTTETPAVNDEPTTPLSEEESRSRAQGYFEEAQVTIQQNDWRESSILLKKAIELDPQHVSARVNLGWALAELQEWDEATRHLHEAIKLDDSNPEAHSNLAWVYAEKGQWPLAIQEGKKATNLNPNNPYAFATLGWAYKETDARIHAINAYNKAIALKPDLASAHLAVGVVLCDDGRINDAREHIGHLNDLDASLASKLAERLQEGCP